MFHVKQQAAGKVFPQVMPIVENPARITVVPSSRVCLVFQIRGKRRPYRQYQKPVDKKREPDRFPRSGSCLMTTRNRIKYATSVVPYYHIIRQCCIFVSIFLKKIRNFLKKSIPTEASISLYYNKIHMTTCFLYRLYPLHRRRGRCRPDNRVRPL